MRWLDPASATCSQALRSAQLELLATRQYQHPFFWAAFLPAGESTPIKD